MTKRQAESYARLVTNLERLGFEQHEVDQLIRIERTLGNWATAECNGEIERDEQTGKPVAVSRLYTQGHINKRVTWPTADREAGALRRLAKIMEPRKRRLIAYHQGDPRGCQLYIVRRRDIPKDGTVSQYYTRGIAVCY